MSIEARFRLDYARFSLDVDLVLPGTGVTALFGASGSGKTTLLRAIAGLECVPDGRLAVGGELWQDETTFVPPHQRPLGYVFQDSSLFSHLSVQGNLDYGRRRCKDRRAGVDFRAIVALLGIGHLLERRPERLSGGERQRVAIARALLTEPRLLLMDEPLAALDQARKNEFLPYLEQLQESLRIPVLYVSHAADEVARLADHLVLLEAGRVLANGPLAETLARLDLPLRLGEEAGVVLEGCVVERDANWQLARVCLGDGTDPPLLWVRDGGHAVGKRLRVRVLARDVSIAREKILATSILNSLRARVVALADDAHPAQALAQLAVGGSLLLARITRRSVAALELRPGHTVWAQIKTAALIG